MSKIKISDLKRARRKKRDSLSVIGGAYAGKTYYLIMVDERGRLYRSDGTRLKKKPVERNYQVSPTENGHTVLLKEEKLPREARTIGQPLFEIEKAISNEPPLHARIYGDQERATNFLNSEKTGDK